MPNDPWLNLCLAPEMGSVTIATLLEQFGTAAAIVAAPRKELIHAGLAAATVTALANPDAAKLAAAHAWLEQDNHHLVHWHDNRYPSLLRETGQSPPVLFVDGNPDLLSLPQIAIVGSRNATGAGLENAMEFAADLARAGLIVTSGLAAGVDAAAHKGAIKGGGNTLAILGTGPDIIYPRENQRLAEAIREHGALVSEFPPGMPVRRDHFPRRNRVMSGLSLGVLVVEAGMRSGSLITARYAGDFGREVFAVPGSIHSPVSKGCHRLIKQGAKLVENSTDIMEELAALAGALSIAPGIAEKTPQATDDGDSDYKKLLRSMGFEPVDIKTLVNRTGLTAGELSSMLLILELKGRVETLAGGRFQQLTGWNKTHE